MSVTKPKGFLAAGMHCGIKDSTSNSNLDLALVAVELAVDNNSISDNSSNASSGNEPSKGDNVSTGATTAAVFTSNKVQAAPVLVSKKHLSKSKNQVKAVILNSGCANAATGELGDQNAISMCKGVAKEIGANPEEVLVCSTGLIGFQLPIENILGAIPELVSSLGGNSDNSSKAAKAIMTTDTKPKEHFIEGAGFCVGGMAKGAAMLSPDMLAPDMGPPSATMLSVVTTDAKCEPDELQSILNEAVGNSFNKLTVDGVQSTNDTVILMSSGLAGTKPKADVLDAVQKVCQELAYMMAADAEGATKVVALNISGAGDDKEAELIGKYLANSLLLKCSWHGADAYWGRLASEIGAACSKMNIELDYSKLSFSYGEHTVFEKGEALDLTSDQAEALSNYMKEEHIDIYIGLSGRGREDENEGDKKGTAKVLTTDLGYGYIDENSQTS